MTEHHHPRPTARHLTPNASHHGMPEDHARWDARPITSAADKLRVALSLIREAGEADLPPHVAQQIARTLYAARDALTAMERTPQPATVATPGGAIGRAAE